MFHLTIIADSFRKEKLEKSNTEFVILEIILSKFLANANISDDIGDGI